MNTLSIKNFGTIEFWFAMIKVVTIVAFLILGTALVMGFGFPRIGTGNFTAHGGFFPNGWTGVGLGVTMAIFSFLGLEIVGVTAGEAVDAKTAVPRARRGTYRMARADGAWTRSPASCAPGSASSARP